MNSGTGFVFMFMSLITYLSCLIYSIIILISTGTFMLFPLISSQIFAHIFLVVGIFLAKDKLARDRFNLKKVLEKCFNYSRGSFSFLLLFHGIFLLMALSSGGSVMFRAISTLIYLNLYLLYGRR